MSVVAPKAEVRWRQSILITALPCCCTSVLPQRVFNMLRRYSRAFSRTTGRVRWSRSPGGVLLRCTRLSLSASRPAQATETRMSAQMPKCSMDEIAARASQYLEGEIEAAEFCDKLLHAIAHADQGPLIALAKAITDHAEDTD
jgi:hypothetical protein